jgi:hypothetical protein
VGLLVGVLLTASMLVALRVLAIPPAPARLSRDALIVSFLIAVVVPGVAQTGQREQIAAILMLPYALLAARAASGVVAPRSLAVTCGLLAGVGLALKPFFLVPWAAVELIVLMRRRTVRSLVRAESVTILLIQIVYGALVLVFTPEYVTRVAPLVQATYNVGYAVDKSLITQTGRFRKLTLLGLAAVATIVWRRHTSPAFTQVFGAATLGWLASYIVQSKAYFYQLLPAMAFATVAFVAAAIEMIEGLRALPRQSWISRLATAALSFGVVVGGVWLGPVTVMFVRDTARYFRYPYPPGIPQMVEATERLASGEPVYLMTTNVFPSFPLVNLAGAKWPYHYVSLWPIPTLYPYDGTPIINYRPPESQPPLEREFFDTVVSDLRRVPPRVLIVDRTSSQQAMGGRTFDFIRYFSASPEFESLMRRYRSVGSVADYDFYELIR